MIASIGAVSLLLPADQLSLGLRDHERLAHAPEVIHSRSGSEPVQNCSETRSPVSLDSMTRASTGADYRVVGP